MTRPTLNILVGVLLVLFNALVMALNFKDMADRLIPASSQSLSDWFFDLVVIASTLIAATILPLSLKTIIAALYVALFASDMIMFGPNKYFEIVFGRYGDGHDIFFGIFIWVVQTLLLLITGAILVARKAYSRQSRPKTLPS